jgi:CRISPR-associated protein Cas1
MRVPFITFGRPSFVVGRRSMRRGAMQLVVDEYGLFVGLRSERAQVRKGKATLQDAPLFELEQVLLMGSGISVSTDLVEACADRGIPIYVLSSLGKPTAMLVSAGLAGTVKTRREQLLAYADGRGVTLAKEFARGKCLNQANLLKYMAKYRKQKDEALYQTVWDTVIEIETLAHQVMRLVGERVDEIRPSLLNREGRAADLYWQAMGKLLREGVEWPGREHRGTGNPINMALNYGYKILQSQVEHALLLAGLDPYGGFVHVDRPGKPSLVLDVMEEFRQPVVDRTIFGWLNKGVDIQLDDEGGMTLATRRLLAERVLERLAGTEKYEGKKHTLKAILAYQASHIATFVRGERVGYEPFLASW